MDYLFKETPAANCYSLVHAQAQAKNNKEIELHDFDETVAVEYVFNCLDRELLSDQRFDQAVKLIIKKCGTNPLVLHQNILYMEQEKILRKTKDSFFVFDIEKFIRTINTLTPELNDTLKKRHDLIKKHLSESDYILYMSFLAILSVFRKLSKHLYERMFSIETENLLYYLIKLGLVKHDDTGNIIFYHQKLEKFYFMMRNDAASKKDIENRIQKLKDQYFQVKFIIYDKINAVSEDLFRSAIEQSAYLDYENEYRFVNALYCQLDFFDVSADMNLHILDIYYPISQRHRGIRKKIYQQTIDVNNIISNALKYKTYLTIFWRIVLSCVNALIQLHDNDEAYNILSKTEQKISSFDASEKDRKNVLSALYNRFGVIYQTFSNVGMAEEYLYKSLNLGLEIQDRYKIIEAYSDLGSLYYDQKDCIPKTCHFWEMLFQYFASHPSKKYEYLFPKAYYHIIYVFLLKHQYVCAEIFLNDYKKEYWAFTEGHYKIKILFMNVVLEMFKAKDVAMTNRHEISLLLDCIEDECVSNGTVREYYKVFYLRGVFEYYFLSEKDKAYENFQISFEQIISFCKNSDTMMRRYLPTLTALEVYIDELMKQYRNEKLFQLRSDLYLKSKKRLQHIRETYPEHYIMPLSDKTEKIRLPKL